MAKEWECPDHEAVERAWRAGLLRGFSRTVTPPLISSALPDGISRVELIRGIGNAIVPQVAAAFIRAYME